MRNNPFRGIAITSGILSYLAGATIVGIFIGRWLDDYFQTTPLFLIIGLLLGLAAGVYGMIKIVNKYLGD
ncbi:AtpZ/AtpI family protein [Bacillaceae bacterium W0354]